DGDRNAREAHAESDELAVQAAKSQMLRRYDGFGEKAGGDHRKPGGAEVECTSLNKVMTTRGVPPTRKIVQSNGTGTAEIRMMASGVRRALHPGPKSSGRRLARKRPSRCAP